MEHKLNTYDASELFTPFGNQGQIGCGGFGKVRICKNSKSEKLAVKYFFVSGSQVEENERLTNEAAVLHKVAHPHIMKVYGVTKWDNYIGIVTEYLPGGNLDGFLKSKTLRHIPWSLRLRIAVQISNAISHLHQYKPNKEMIHGDVKAENVLLTADLDVKLADFGSVNMSIKPGASTTTTNLTSSLQYTLYYTAPEYLKDPFKEHTTEMDVYSYGMLLYEILTRMRVFENVQRHPDIIISVIRDRAQRPDQRPLDGVKDELDETDLKIFMILYQQMQKCWAQKPEKRPNIQTVQNELQVYLNDINNDVINLSVNNVIEQLNRREMDFDISMATTLDKLSSIDSSAFESNKLSSFEFLVDVDRDVIDLLQHSSYFLSELSTELNNEVRIQFIPDSSGKVKVIIESQSTQEKCSSMNQSLIKSDCQSKIESYLNKFVSKDEDYSCEDINRIRNQFNWKNKQNCIEDDIGNKTVRIFVRWQENEQRSLTVTGLPGHVTHFIKWFESNCQFTKETVTLNDRNFLISQDCGILSDIEDQFVSSLHIDVDAENRRLIFDGEKEYVTEAVQLLQENLTQIKEEKLCYLPYIKQDFLKDSIYKSIQANKYDVAEYIRINLRLKGIKVLFYYENRNVFLLFLGKNIEEPDRAIIEISELIKVHEFELTKNLLQEMMSDEYKNLKSKITESGTVQIIENNITKTIKLVGLPISFNNEVKRFNSFLNDIIETKITVDLQFAKARYLCTFSQDYDAETGLSKVDWSYVAGGIQLLGKACNVRKASKWIEQTSNKLSTEYETISSPKMNKFLKDEQGKRFLLNTGSDSQCLILVCEDEPKQKSTKTIQMQGCSFKIKLTSEDILKSTCDVIIKLANSETNKDQKPTKKFLEVLNYKFGKKNRNHFHPSAGIREAIDDPQSRFRRIIYLKIPSTSFEIRSHLLDAFVFVEKTLKLKSLVVSALEMRGATSLSDLEIATSFKNAIEVFKTINPVYFTQLDIVITNDKTLNIFKHELWSSYASVSLNSLATTSHPAEHSTTSFVKVAVKYGDILSSDCDVIVSTAGSFYEPSGKLSQTLLQVCGTGVDPQIPSNILQESRYYRVTRGGSTNFQRIIHIISALIIMEENLKNILYMVDTEMKLNSIAIPAIGTGNAKYNPLHAAKIVQSAIASFIETNPKHLQRIDVVIFDIELLETFKSIIINTTEQENVELSKKKSNEGVTLSFTSPILSNIIEAQSKVQAKSEELSRM